MQLIENVRHWWRFWSVRCNALGLALLGWGQFDPVGALYVWQMMPAEVRDVLPRHIVAIIGALFFILSIIARLVQQPDLKEQTDAPAN